MKTIAQLSIVFISTSLFFSSFVFASGENKQKVIDKRLRDLQSHATFLEKHDISNGVKLNYSPVFNANDESFSSANFLNMKNRCDVEISINPNDNILSGSESFGTLSDVDFLNLTEQQEHLQSEFVLGHEVAHCGFYKFSAPFLIPGNQELTVLLNKYYADNISSVKAINGVDVNFYGLAYFLNEAFAEAYSAVLMYKKYGGTPEIKVFLAKMSALREISTFFSVLDETVIDAYDLKRATSLVLSDYFSERIDKAKNAQELRMITLEIANFTVLDSLAKKSDKELKAALGQWMFPLQLKEIMFSHDGLLKPGSVVSNQLLKNVEGLSEIDKRGYSVLLNGDKNSPSFLLNSSALMSSLFGKLNSSVGVDNNDYERMLIAMNKELKKIRDIGWGKKKNLETILIDRKDLLGFTYSEIKEIRLILSHRGVWKKYGVNDLK